jgi:hypothetical protein
MEREQEERLARYVAGQTLLYNRERDIALAAYDGDAAADAILALAETLHGVNEAAGATLLESEAETLEAYGRCIASAALRRVSRARRDWP